MNGSPSLRQVALSDFEHELASTRRALERVPAEHLSWRPHPRSMSLGMLAFHIANIVMWQRSIVQTDEYDFAAGPPPRTDDPATTAEILEHFDANAAAVRAELQGTDDTALNRQWTLRSGEHVIARATKAQMLRGFGISHLIHHRGQLTVYLRLLDLPVPSMYGPTADER